MARSNERFEEVIKQTAAEFIQTQSGPASLITVTRVLVDDKRKSVQILFTTLPDNKQDMALVFLKRKRSEFIQYLKDNTRMRAIPGINFDIDYGERNRQHIDSLLQ
ncbi:MAG: hypothetical protein RJA61_724 [Candidatus Parcubacteria bacterium]|jgi:ribosome-binding factor A